MQETHTVADRARLQSVQSSGNLAVDRGVHEAALKEKERRSLRGPIPVSDVPTGSTLARRFGVIQKRKRKAHRRL